VSTLPQTDVPSAPRGRTQADPTQADPSQIPAVDVFFVGMVFFDLIFGGIDQLPEPGTETWVRDRAVSAGGTANRAVAAARLGLHAGMAVAAGTDVFGDHLRTLLGDVDNLDLRWFGQFPTVATAVTVSLTHATDRRFITHGSRGPVPVRALAPQLPRARAAHLAVAPEVPEWAREMRSAGTKLFGGVGWDAEGEWSPEILASLGHFDAFVPNATEAMAYTRTDTPRAALGRLADHVPLVAVTCGDQGAIAVDGETGEEASAPSIPVRAVDPTGAGDIFTAAFIFGTVHGWPLRDRLLLANLCAGLSVRQLGGARSAPGWHDIEAWLAQAPSPDGFDAGRVRSFLRDRAVPSQVS
jgi:sugar/nucleoside kinase (ribokinase family)